MTKKIVTVLGGTCMLLAATAMAVMACPDITPKTGVRELSLATKGGALGMLIVTSDTEARAAWGDDVANKLAEIVDFTREKVVRISFETSGPPDDFLRHEVDGKNVKFVIVSFTGKRHQRLGQHVHMFAVPADTKVNLTHEPILRDDEDTDLPSREREERDRFFQDTRMRYNEQYPVQDTRRLLILKPLHEWQGKFLADEPLMKAAPQSGFIANEKAWAELCKAWNLSKDLPKIDFNKQIALVNVAPGSANSFQATMVTLNGMTGELSAFTACTEIAGSGFIYMIRVVDRTGVKTINGKAIGM